MVNTYTQIYIHIRIIFISSPKIHFPTRGSRLDAAPTELIACCSPVTIKILLLRSITGPTNVQTPGTGVLARQIAENGFQMSKLQGLKDLIVSSWRGTV